MIPRYSINFEIERPNLYGDIDFDWLKKTALDINEGKLNLKYAGANAKFFLNGHFLYYPISQRTLKRIFDFHHIEIKPKKGAPKKVIPNEKKIYISQFYEHLRCGETITYNSIKAVRDDVTLYEVQKVFEENGYYKKKSKNKTKKIRCRYQAKYVNQILHADVHYLKDSNFYLYAIIEDRSRFIVGHKIIAEKTCQECTEVLKNAINEYGKPAIIWTDNGGENIGDYIINYLMTERIYPVTITPGNPQQNGKIEAFWPKMEDFIRHISEIDSYIERYNFHKAHMGLEKGPKGNRLRPCDVFCEPSYKWQKDYEWTWYKYGKEVPFPVDLEKKKLFYD